MKERGRQEINHYDNMKPDHDQQSQMAQGMGNCGEHLWLRNGDQASSCCADTDLQSTKKESKKERRKERKKEGKKERKERKKKTRDRDQPLRQHEA